MHLKIGDDVVLKNVLLQILIMDIRGHHITKDRYLENPEGEPDATTGRETGFFAAYYSR